MRFLVTNHGTHPPDKWAELMTAQILDFIQIEEGAATEIEAQRRSAFRRAKMELQLPLFTALEEIFDTTQKAEKSELAKRGVQRAAEAISHKAEVDAGLNKLHAVFGPTPFRDHFASEKVNDVLKRMLAQYLGNVIHIERSLEMDKNPNTPQAQAFRAKHHPEG